MRSKEYAIGNKSSPIHTAKIKAVREGIADQQGFYLPEDLLKEHPFK